MGAVHIPAKVKVFAGLFSQDVSLFVKSKRFLERSFGRVDYESAILDFSHTDYYRDEFGSDLKRQFFGFSRPIGLENLYKIKLTTNRVEGIFTKNGRRTVNIDPGCLTLSKVILLTTKDYTHRIYLAKGIYAEVTLHYKDGTFSPWPWTYPDYRTKEYIDIFNAIRKLVYNKELIHTC